METLGAGDIALIIGALAIVVILGVWLFKLERRRRAFKRKMASVYDEKLDPPLEESNGMRPYVFSPLPGPFTTQVTEIQYSETYYHRRLATPVPPAPIRETSFPMPEERSRLWDDESGVIGPDTAADDVISEVFEDIFKGVEEHPSPDSVYVGEDAGTDHHGFGGAGASGSWDLPSDTSVSDSSDSSDSSSSYDDSSSSDSNGGDT
jgi:hypothetical protein